MSEDSSILNALHFTQRIWIINIIINNFIDTYVYIHIYAYMRVYVCVRVYMS